MKLLKTVPAALLLTGGLLASMHAVADDSVFTVMDDPSSAKKPFEGNLNAGYLAQSGNTKSSSLTADTTMTGTAKRPHGLFGEMPAIPPQMMSVHRRNMP